MAYDKKFRFGLSSNSHVGKPVMKKIFLIASLFGLTGGSLAMTTYQQVPDTNCPKDAIFKFKKHQFSALCFNTKGCRVEYANFYDVNDPDEKISPAPPADVLSRVGGERLGISNFPEPAKVTWRSLDGVRHAATIDMSAIFRSQCILHDVPREKIAEGIYVSSPSIVLVVNDREISIYMRAMIPLREPSRPNNPHSDVAWTTALAYRQSF